MAAVYKGIFPALQCPFTDKLAIDEPELRKFSSWLASHHGIGGLVTNGHTGEVFALTGKQRAEVTRIVADEVKGKLPVISGLCCEGIAEAAEHAVMAREAGATGLLVMPPHGWLRFGMEQPNNVVDYFTAIGEASGLDQVVHIYPAWTRASYSFETLAQLARLPWVKCMKVGTRDMNKYARDLMTIKAADPSVTVVTCHDEYLLASMVQGVDGALVGFASFIPQQIIDLYAAVQAGDLKKAQQIQAWILPLKDVVYGGGEPTGGAHARMKMAMYLAGILKSPRVQPPTRLPEGDELKAIEAAVRNAGLLQRAAA
ncbi:dihydrodipicolinate synthase family protein [Rhodoplanes roseus]|uniref:Dihydrodipicolinate synthase family protein n=1 Tax=Rhodoplanes roseus TaxID=29409 RepID=A0A327LAV9_9BRAD|nr:dihydrodipicolinate synthase family protein [Rhodoplanes roseus]RAI44868.1 dihydrodipicolinate synthase family protein [Rhodoplanes roseus]